MIGHHPFGDLSGYCEDGGMPDKTMQPAYTTRPLTADTWGDFAALVEANNGVWGGCWCMGFHPEGVGKGSTVSRTARPNTRTYARERSTRSLSMTATFVRGGASTARLQSFLPSRTRGPTRPNSPSCRTGRSARIFTGKGHRRTGIARVAVAGALAAIKEAGGGSSRHTPSRSRAGAPARRLFPHRPGELVRGVRIRARPTDRPSGAG